MAGIDAYIADSIARGSKSFAKAALLFDRETRRSVMALYAWCRHCDDVIDGQTLGHAAQYLTPAEKAARLQGLRDLTNAVFAGQPTDVPAFQALYHVVQRHDLPQKHVVALLDGFAMDVEDTGFATLDDVLRYAYHVAGVVGVMMAWIMGVRDTATLHSASDLGIAFQLTNIARDVMDDAKIGRCYLPRDWLLADGMDWDNFAEKHNRQKLLNVTKKLLQTSDAYYRSARIGMTHLGTRDAWAIATALSVYRAIGAKLLRGGPNAWNTRVGTSATSKIMRLLGAWPVARFGAGKRREHLSRDDLWTTDLL